MRRALEDRLRTLNLRTLRTAYRRQRKAVVKDRLFRKVYAKYRNHTMLTEGAFVENLKLAEAHIRRNHLENGCVVECGTWRGGMSFGLVEALPKVEEFHCFDSFQGLPKVGPLDGETARRMQEEGRFVAVNNYTSMEEFESGLCLLDSARRACVHVHPGWFTETLPGFVPTRPISLLRIDCDWYDSVMLVLEQLFDRVQDQGLIVIDDYTHWVGCARAVHDFLSKRQACERICQTAPDGISFIVKVAAAA